MKQKQIPRAALNLLDTFAFNAAARGMTVSYRVLLILLEITALSLVELRTLCVLDHRVPDVHQQLSNFPLLLWIRRTIADGGN